MTYTHTATSIDGNVEFTLAELLAGVGNDWSDTSSIPVWAADDNRVGSIDPDTGIYSEVPDPEHDDSTCPDCGGGLQGCTGCDRHGYPCACS